MTVSVQENSILTLNNPEKSGIFILLDDTTPPPFGQEMYSNRKVGT